MTSVVHDQHEHTASTARDPGPADFPDLDSIRVALDAGQIGVWSWDIKSNAMRWSGNLDGGMPPAGTLADFQNGIHPEDQPEVMAAIQESLRDRKPYHAQYR